MALYRVVLGADFNPLWKEFEIEAKSEKQAIKLAKEEYQDSNWANEVEIDDFGDVEVEKLVK